MFLHNKNALFCMLLIGRLNFIWHKTKLLVYFLLHPYLLYQLFQVYQNVVFLYINSGQTMNCQVLNVNSVRNQTVSL